MYGKKALIVSDGTLLALSCTEPSRAGNSRYVQQAVTVSTLSTSAGAQDAANDTTKTDGKEKQAGLHPTRTQRRVSHRSLQVRSRNQVSPAGAEAQ